MALGENIKRERMIPVHNKIVYRNLEQELAEMREREKNSAEPPIFSTDDIALSLHQLNHFEEESSLPHNHFIQESILDIESFLLVLELNLEGQILKANELICKTLQLDAADLSTRTFKEFLPKEKQADWQRYQEILRKGEKIQDILELLPKNQEEKILLASTICPIFHQGMLQKILLVAQNITTAISNYKNNTTIELDIDKNLKSAKIIVKI
jgi:PAS domain-containing protein